MKKINVLILFGDGINCENDCSSALKEIPNANPKLVHVNQLLSKPEMLKEFSSIILPGGFSFGDDLGSGQILGLKLKYGADQFLNEFIQNGGSIIGICNGFQILLRLGLLPNLSLKNNYKKNTSLVQNESGHFQDRWVNLKLEGKTNCIWLKGLEDRVSFAMPIRHGEGRIVFSEPQNELYQRLHANGQVALRYTENVNGSYENIAGISDESGRIFGLMPHPEAAIYNYLSPFSKEREGFGIGLKFFENMIEFHKRSLG